MKKSAAAALILMVLLFGGAYLTAMEPDAPAPETPQAQGDGEVVLTIKTGEAAERMTLRDYLVGVVRGEMPASFEMEALKAQAAAERTYVYYQLAQGRKDAHPDADFCTDHTCCSAYLSETAAKEKWAADFAPWNTRVVQAVADTDGLVALYDGEPILAVFHSSSAGRTAAARGCLVRRPALSGQRRQPGECRHRAQLLQHRDLHRGGGKRPSAGGPPGDKTHRRAGDVVRCGDGK